MAQHSAVLRPATRIKHFSGTLNSPQPLSQPLKAAKPTNPPHCAVCTPVVSPPCSSIHCLRRISETSWGESGAALGACTQTDISSQYQHVQPARTSISSQYQHVQPTRTDISSQYQHVQPTRTDIPERVECRDDVAAFDDVGRHRDGLRQHREGAAAFDDVRICWVVLGNDIQ